MLHVQGVYTGTLLGRLEHFEHLVGYMPVHHLQYLFTTRKSLHSRMLCDV